MNTTELARREQRAQHGIIEFAEEMQAIRDGNLYPGAKSDPDAWGIYCKERWGMSKGSVNDQIRALPVFQRLMIGPADHELPLVTSAEAVATLPEPIQDAILAQSPKSDDVKAMAKSVRKKQKDVYVKEGRDATEDELVEAALTVKPPAKKKKSKMKASKFTEYLGQADWFLDQAADIANSKGLDATENDWGWDRIKRIEEKTERVKDMLTKPDFIRDWDDEAAVLLGDEA